MKFQINSSYGSEVIAIFQREGADSPFPPTPPRPLPPTPLHPGLDRVNLNIYHLST